MISREGMRPRQYSSDWSAARPAHNRRREHGLVHHPGVLAVESRLLIRYLRLLTMPKVIRSPLGVEAAASEIIKATCAATHAQAGSLVLLNLDSLDPSYSFKKPSQEISSFLSEIIGIDDVSHANAFFYVHVPTKRGMANFGRAYPVYIASELARFGHAVSIPLTDEDTNLGLIWLASKRHIDGAVLGALSELGSVISIIVQNACLFARMARQQQEAGALYQISRDISSRLDLDSVLMAIVERACQLLGVDAAHLDLPDHETGEFYCAVSHGIETSEYRSYRTKESTHGLIAKAICERKTVYTNNYLQNKSFSHPTDEDFLREGIREMMCAPLFIGDKLLGAIVVCNKDDRPFTDQQADLLSSLANYGAVAMENARLYEDERKTVLKLQELNALIDSQYTTLKKSVSIHDQLTRVALDGEGVEGIIGSLSRIVGNPVVVEDNQFNVLSAAPCKQRDRYEALDTDVIHHVSLRELTDKPEVREQITFAIQRRRPTRIPRLLTCNLEAPRILTPIVLGSDIVAYMWVLEINRPVEELEFTAIEHGATVLALEMAKMKARAEAERRLRGDLVHDLLFSEGLNGEAMRQRAVCLGLDPSHMHRVAVVRIDGFSDFAHDLKSNGENIVAIRTRLLEVVKRSVMRLAPQSIVADRSDGVIAILGLGPSSSGATGSRVVQMANQIREEVRRQLAEISVSVGVGSLCSNINELKRSFEEANRSLDILERMNVRDSVTCFDDLGVYRVIFRAGDQDEHLRFAQDMIGKLMEYDKRRGTLLVDTLEAYLNNSCHLKNTAEKMYVHLNTLRHRLEKIEEIAGVSLSDAETRLNLQLAIKIARAYLPQPNSNVHNRPSQT